MLMIRLARSGSKHRPFYHIRASDKRNARDGRFNEQLGYFNPVARGQEQRLVIDCDRITQLLEQGAQISDRVARLMRDSQQAAEKATRLDTDTDTDTDTDQANTRAGHQAADTPSDQKARAATAAQVASGQSKAKAEAKTKPEAAAQPAEAAADKPMQAETAAEPIAQGSQAKVASSEVPVAQAANEHSTQAEKVMEEAPDQADKEPKQD